MMRSAGRLLSVLVSEGRGGALARRLLPAVVSILALLGFLRWQGEKLELYGTRVGVVLLTVAAIAVIFGLLLHLCGRLDEYEVDRQQAEVQLWRSAQYFDLARDLLCTAGFDGCFKDLNAAWTKTLGWSESELRSRPFVDFVHPEDREATERETARLVPGEVTVDFINRYRTKDGGWRWLDWSAHAAPDEGLIYASARDVSERKLTEGYLAAQHEATRVLAEAGSSEEALPALLRAIGEHVGWSVGAFWSPSRDRPGGELRCAAFWHAPGAVAKQFEAATKRLELAPGEGLPGRVLESRRPRWVPDVSAEPDYPRAEAALTDGLHACIVIPIVSGAGVLGVIEFLSDEIRQPNRALLEALDMVSRQIGQFLERRRGEAALEASERQVRQILETALEAFVSIDEHSRIIAWNSQAETTFGWSCEEALGRGLAETIIPEAYRDAHRRGVECFLASGEAPILGKPLELSALHRDGREFPVELTITALATEDSYSFNAFLRDISERKRVEAELAEARDQALEASKHKSYFLANMSHEIRTPMNGVIGMTGLLLDTQLDPQQRRYAETVRSSGEALLAIINDILDFSKIEADKVELEVIDFDLRTFIEEVADLLAERAHAKGLELAVLVESDVPIDVRGDGGRLRQVLTNLLGNAVKFTERGEVVVRVELIEENGDDALIRFEVADTGVGVPRERQAMLFEPFSQADASTTRTYGGTGLGLSISKRLVELMGGEIGLESAPGEGSCFWLTVRLSKVSDGRRRLAARREELRGLRVLIVDDNETNRQILDRQVGSWGMQSGLAGGGERALELLRQAVARGEPYDVALLDMNMPGMDGLELARAIRADDALPTTPLLLLTSYGLRGAAELARQAGISAFLAKPVRQSQLYDAIALVIGSGVQQPELVTRHTVSEARARARPRLLLAEDNSVNQQVALAMLQKIGYRADAVANGVEAVEALSQGHYGAVLMDCQMPELDGYEATREIRRREGGERRTPIIAMTAGAMQGDREKALEAGMDDYISKPVELERLADVLGRWVGGEDELRAAPAGGNAAGATVDTLDQARLSELRSLQRPGEPDILAELVRAFLHQAPSQLASLRAAVDAGDTDALRREAHALKGSAANLAAKRMAAVCAELEALDPARDQALAAQASSRLESELERVQSAFHAELQPNAED